MAFPLCRGRLKLNHASWFNLHLGHFPLVDYQSGHGKTSGHHNQHFPQAFAYYCLLTDIFLFFNYRQLQQWAISCSCLLIWAYGTHLLKLYGGHSTFALWLHSFRYTWSGKGSWPPSPRQGPGEMQPHQDMTFILIAPSLAIGCEWDFGLIAVLMHPHQIQLPTLAEVAQKLMLLADEGINWPYAHARMNDAMAHAPLSSERHIGVMTSGLPSRNTCSCLHQLQMWWLPQCRGWVVCPDGLNGSLKPLLFNFKELLLWSAANVDGLTQDLPMIDVDLNDMVPKVPPPPEQRSPQPKSQGSTGAATMGFPSHPTLSLTIHHLKDSTAINSLGSSSPNPGNRKFS